MRPAPIPAASLRLFAWYERPRVEVRHDDGLWYRGWLRAWRLDETSGWRATVTYHVAIGRQHYREVPAAYVRRASETPDDVDAGEGGSDGHGDPGAGGPELVSTAEEPVGQAAELPGPQDPPLSHGVDDEGAGAGPGLLLAEPVEVTEAP